MKWYRQRQKANRTGGFDTATAINEMTHTIALGSKKFQKRSRKTRKKHLNKNYNYVKSNDLKPELKESHQLKGPKAKRCDTKPVNAVLVKPCSSQPTSARLTKCLVAEVSAPTSGTPFAPFASPEVSDIDSSFSPQKNIDVNREITSTAVKERISRVKSSNKYSPNRDETKDKSAIHQTCFQAIEKAKPSPDEISDNQTPKTFQISKASKSGRHCSAPTLLFLRPTPSPTFVTLNTLKGELQSITETVASQSETGGWSNTEYSWDEENERSNDDECKRSAKCYRFWSALQSGLKVLVNHNYFDRAMFLAILFNTLCMGIEYHNQPQSLTQAVEISNVIFTGMSHYVCHHCHHFHYNHQCPHCCHNLHNSITASNLCQRFPSVDHLFD